VKVRLGVTAVAPTFCTTIVLRRPTPAAFFAAYGPYTVAAPPLRPSVEYATGAATSALSD